jgi:hypothetical protein
MDSTFANRVKAIDWTAYHTAYGRADGVPDQLLLLTSTDRSKALKASHELWCGLCHQHVQIGTAALPAFSFLLEVLEVADEDLAAEILDILVGFALGTNRKRSIDWQKACGRDVSLPEPAWVASLRLRLLAEVPRFRKLSEHANADIADPARRILEELAAET